MLARIAVRRLVVLLVVGSRFFGCLGAVGIVAVAGRGGVCQGEQRAGIVGPVQGAISTHDDGFGAPVGHAAGCIEKLRGGVGFQAVDPGAAAAGVVRPGALGAVAGEVGICVAVGRFGNQGCALHLEGQGNRVLDLHGCSIDDAERSCVISRAAANEQVTLEKGCCAGAFAGEEGGIRFGKRAIGGY